MIKSLFVKWFNLLFNLKLKIDLIIDFSLYFYLHISTLTKATIENSM